MAPKVTLISCTPDAEHLLVFTKNTRLNLSPALFNEIKHWPRDKMNEEIAYMASTIKSSYEFVDVVFLAEGVTRACAQQMTRTRTGSYAMQSQRVTDASKMDITNPFEADSEDSGRRETFTLAAAASKHAYQEIIAAGGSSEDARGILPINTTCNLVCKYNLRSFVDLVKARSSLRVQKEYASIVQQMKSCVLAEWPWAAPFFVPEREQAIQLLEQLAHESGITPGSGFGWQLAKIADLLRS